MNKDHLNKFLKYEVKLTHKEVELIKNWCEATIYNIEKQLEVPRWEKESKLYKELKPLRKLLNKLNKSKGWLGL